MRRSTHLLCSQCSFVFRYTEGVCCNYDWVNISFECTTIHFIDSWSTKWTVSKSNWARTCFPGLLSCWSYCAGACLTGVPDVEETKRVEESACWLNRVVILPKPSLLVLLLKQKAWGPSVTRTVSIVHHCPCRAWYFHHYHWTAGSQVQVTEVPILH